MSMTEDNTGDGHLKDRSDVTLVSNKVTTMISLNPQTDRDTIEDSSAVDFTRATVDFTHVNNTAEDIYGDNSLPSAGPVPKI